jgi:hypothetical protein
MSHSQISSAGSQQTLYLFKISIYKLLDTFANYFVMAIMSHTANAGFSGNGSTYMPFLGLLRAHKIVDRLLNAIGQEIYFYYWEQNVQEL